MTVLRWALVLVAAASLAGCTDDDTPSKTGVDARTSLSASTSGLAAGNYHFIAKTAGYKFEGRVHLPSNSWEDTLTVDVPDRRVFETMVIGQDQYTRSNAAPTWTRSDLSRLPEDSRSPRSLADPDLTGVTSLLAAAVDVTAADGAICGNIDGGRVASNAPWNGLPLQMAGKVPFTAKLDKKGRLAQFVLTFPERPDLKMRARAWTLTIDRYGKSAPPQPPAEFTESDGAGHP